MLKMTSNSDSDTPVTPKKAKITKVLQKYKPEWEKKYNWITSDLQNKSNAKCITCGVNFTISSAGIGQIKQHQNTQKHKMKTEMKKTSGALQNFLTSDTKSRCQGSSDDENIIAAELALTFHTVLIEKLLYSCEKLDKIYLLIREKKNVSPEKRLQHIFEQPIFKRLKSKGADYMQKVVPIVGDISEQNLGVTEEDEKELREKVSVVFHVAATVNFNEPLKVAMNINFEGTRRVLNLCKKMKQLQTFVYVSTAYTNTNREIIEEVIYPPPASYEEVYTALEQYGDNDKDIRKLLCDRPNTYTFTKALAEHYVAEQQNKIPTVIIRPSIVVPSINEPLEGWVDNWFGATSLMVMIGKGHYRVVAGASSNLIDLIPVDYVSNLSIAAAAKCKGYDGLLVYNCCTSGANPVTYGAVCRCFIEESVRFKLNDIPYPTINFTKHQWILKTIIFIIQMIPAFFADCFLWLSGKRPRYVKLQRKVLGMNNTQQYFTSRSWVMDSKETQALYASLSDLDKNLFPFNPVNIVWSEYLPVYYKGVKTYLF